MRESVEQTWDRLEWEGDARQITDRTYFVSALSNVVAFETDEGVVLIDTGIADALHNHHAPEMAEQLRSFTDEPIHTVVYTHGHIDHVRGLGYFLAPDQEPPRIVAHERMADRFVRYEKTAAHNEAINTRQVCGTPEMDTVAEDSAFETPEYPPTVYYDDRLTLTVGDTAFDVVHDRGETDDHSWVYCPEREVLCSGDFFINQAPNAGNPQKVQRYPEEWAQALERMASKGARHLCPGHGDPIVDDAETVRRALTSTARYLDAIVEQTIEALNDGAPPHTDIVHRVDPPETEAEWLEERYDEAEFVVRNLIRKYGGWWTGRPSELKPAPRGDLAAEVAALAGGPEALAERALALAADEEYRLASHLADYALEAAPENEDVQDAVIEVYGTRADEQESLMATNLFRSAAAYASEGRDFV